MNNIIKLFTASAFLFFASAVGANTIYSFDDITGETELAPDGGPAKNCGANGDYCFSNMQFTVNGVTATINATNDSFGLAADNLVPWYDLAPVGRGGIGAATPTEVQNDTRSADNAISGEYIHATFSESVDVVGFWFNGNHVSADGRIAFVREVSSGTLWSVTIANDFADFSAFGITGTDFIVWADSDSEYYLAGISVPEPGTLALLGLGLLGFGLARRRRQTA